MYVRIGDENDFSTFDIGVLAFEYEGLNQGMNGSGFNNPSMKPKAQ